MNTTHDWRPGKRSQIPGVLCLVLAILLSSSISYGYTVLTHEAIIDSVWDASLQKLLLKRFPDATPEQLEQAHAYAHIGAASFRTWDIIRSVATFSAISRITSAAVISLRR
jgi:hypothetical protein